MSAFASAVITLGCNPSLGELFGGKLAESFLLAGNPSPAPDCALTRLCGREVPGYRDERTNNPKRLCQFQQLAGACRDWRSV